MTERIITIIFYELIPLISVSSVITLSLLLSNSLTSALCEGEICAVPFTHEDGVCIDICYCKYAINLIRCGKNPGICGLKGNIPLVCCPIPSKLEDLPGDLSIRKHKQYILLGLRAKFREFPHMAAVGYGETKIAWSCGGSLISHRFVLSAAHCAESIELGPALWLRLGDLTLTNTIKDANSEVFKISEVHIHPKYRISSYYHDIALFKTERQVHFMSHIKPACLQVPRNFSITNLEAIGWGRTGFLDEGSGHLLKADLSVVNHSTCAKRYADVARTRKLTESILDEFQICAGSSEGKDTCLGDSGGPLHYELYRIHTVDNHFVVAGITSFGKGCGGNNSVGVYTRVSAYVRWIENIVWKEDD